MTVDIFNKFKTVKARPSQRLLYFKSLTITTCANLYHTCEPSYFVDDSCTLFVWNSRNLHKSPVVHLFYSLFAKEYIKYCS